MTDNFASLTLRHDVRTADRDEVRELVNSTGFFAEHEVAVAIELLDDRLSDPENSTYRFVFAECSGAIFGYTCFGLIPCTSASYDIYWIAVHQQRQGKGIGGRLLLETERRIAALGGRRAYIETSGRELYKPSRSFYKKYGYREAARLEDFYSPGDPKLIYQKALTIEHALQS